MDFACPKPQISRRRSAPPNKVGSEMKNSAQFFHLINYFQDSWQLREMNIKFLWVFVVVLELDDGINGNANLGISKHKFCIGIIRNVPPNVPSLLP
jgi:hypothetical protein